jgi:hypothetical protein
MGKKYEEAFHQKAYIDASKHIKRCSTPLTIKEMQIRVMMRYHYTLIRIVSINNGNHIKYWRGCRKNRPFNPLLVEIKSYIQTL